MFRIKRLMQTASYAKFSTVAEEMKNVVIVKRLGEIMTIGINRPEKKNAINRATAQQLVKAFQEFENDSSAKVGVMYGKGGTFCAGLDLEDVTNLKENEIEEYVKNAPVGPTRMFFSKPVVAAVSGYAVAGGMELALLCDLRVMEESAVMGIFSRRFGVPLIDGGTVRLPRIVGLGRALDLILTGRPIKAKEALDWGLVTSVVATGTGLGQAIQLASNLLKFPQECMNVDRKSAYQSFYQESADEALTHEWTSAKHVLSLESREGAAKFVAGVGRHGKFNLGDSKIPKV